jgi:hypothetical protein
MPSTRTCLQLASACWLVLAGAHCKKAEPPPRRTAPWLASASAQTGTNPAPLTKRSFRIDPSASQVRFSLPGRKAKPSGHVPIASGSIELSPRDLKSARASVEVDLQGISVDSSSLPEQSELTTAPSTLALQWLELGAEVPTERRAQLGRARFELVSVDAPGAGALEFSAPRPARVRVTAVGTLLLHGFRAPVRVELLLEPLPATTPGALRLAIRSASPLVLPLAPHEIGPRSAAGIADPAEAARAEASVGKTAKIELDLVAEAPAAAP